MARRILNFGSLNIDHVYRVSSIVQPGQTIPSSHYQLFAGGKGANQSAALAKAGADVDHAGRIGVDGRELLEGLAQLGVDTRWTLIDPELPTGHAIIQVEHDSGENAILLFPGANHAVDEDQIHTVVTAADDGSILLSQNEISNISLLLQAGHRRGLFVAFNPAPFTPDLMSDAALAHVDLLIVNESEAVGIAGIRADLPPTEVISALRGKVPARTELLLTLGAQGAVLDRPGEELIEVTAHEAGVVIDTTAAGDTFIGFFLAARARGETDRTALREASVAAAICVTRPGARDAIPSRIDVTTEISKLS